MLIGIAKFSFRQRWLVLLVWVVALVAFIGWSQLAGSAFSTDFKLPNSDSHEALSLLEKRFPARAGATGDLVFKVKTNVTAPDVETQVTSVIEEIKKVPHVLGVTSPYDQEGVGQISLSGQIAKATIQFDQDNLKISQDKETVNAIRKIVEDSQTNNLQFELGGQLFVKPPAVGSEGIGLIAAVIILLIAFGSILAMGLPIIIALFSIGIGLALVGLLAHLLNMPDFTTQLASMIGIGVGIDYALFIVTRFRQGLRENRTSEEAVLTAINTSGRAVIFAGITVVISLLGMLIMNISFIQGLGIGAAVVVGVTMIASITLLPALLGFVGKNIDRFSLPWVSKSKHGEQEGIWYTWSRFLEKRSWLVLIAGLIIIVNLALPVFWIRLGSSDASARPTSDTTRRAYDLQAEGFGAGSNGPLLLAADISSRADLVVLQKAQQAIQRDIDVAFVTPPLPNQDFSAAIMQVIPNSSPQDQGTVELIHRLRKEILPPIVAKSAVEVHVGGITASFDDLGQTLLDRLPLFIGAVLALSFVLLLVVFRSIIIPVKAVILNLLSISAAYGVVVSIFQWGWLKDLFGLGTTGPIESFLPMMLFAILFGLSMDYEVFLLSSIKEEYDRTADNNQAIGHGLNSTARVITAAAAIMVTVFAGFVLGDLRVIKEFGIGLAAAVLIDASIARLLLVPASMEIFGKANWWLPSWLRWLPKLHIDGNEVVAKEN